MKMSPMKKLRLSLCIATYNRAEYIGETLASIISQITDEVEIVVVDGASNDGTPDVVKSYAKSCKQINYIQLPVKGGIDQDFCKAVEAARGKYCWLLPDDDLLKPNAVNTVLKEISKGYSLIIVNAQVMSKDFSKVLKKRQLQIEKNEIYLECHMEQLFKRAVFYMSYIGSVVIDRNVWMEREKKTYFGTEFVHLGVIFQAPLPAATLVIAEPFITIRYGNAQWVRRAIEIWMVKWPTLLGSFEHISEHARRECQMIKFWPKLKKITVFRAMRVYTFKEYLKYFSSQNSPFWWRFTAFFIVVTPACFINSLLLLYLKLVKKEARVTIYDLERK
jgi:abequosyltransferase